MKRVLFVVSVFFLFVFTSCSGFFSNTETGISLRLPGGNKSRAVSEESKTEYFYTVKCENIKNNIDITKYGKTGDLLLFENLVPGSYTITGEAFSDEERTVLKYKGSVEAEVVF